MVGASPSGSAVVDSINNLDAGNPLHVQNSDNINSVIIPFKLLGTKNYRIWPGAMKLALQARNKFGFVDGSCGASVADYYHILNSLFREFDALTKLPKCACEVKCGCDASKELGLHQELMKLMQFLMGLDDCYQLVRSSLLTRELLPKSFNSNNSNNNNKNRRRYNNSNNNIRGNLPSNRGPNPNLNCKHYGKIGHTIDRCFELVGFPNGFKSSSNFNPVKQGFNANADLKQNEKICFGNPSYGFTFEQMQKLLFLINETPSSSIHANMAVVPGYCVVNKLIRDSRMFVGFDDNLYSGSESGGLYLFVKNNKCGIGKSNLVMSFHVSKSLWHSRLGHPTDQVVYVLKNDLSVSKDTFVPGCEVCHKAKQTRKTFPLSDHKSKSLGELVHLDFFDDDGKDTLVVDGSLQPSFDTADSAQGMYQEGWQSATQIDDPHWSKGNVQYGLLNSNPTRMEDNLNDVKTPGLRRSSRQSKLPVKFNGYVLNSSVKYDIEKYDSYSKLKGSNLCFATTLNKFVEPTCLKDVLSDPNWVEAMNNDIEALNKNNTWTECDLPIGRKPIGSKWIWKIKYKASGEIERYKARLVAKGFNQREGFDYDETFSHVMVTVRCLISIVVANSWPLYKLDVNNAFLYGDLKEDVYISLP
ncbi:ribonuclease H-like domain-containing protein, partial [Tanacetum coccineum]